MMNIIAIAFLVAGVTAITNPPITGTTPPAVPCPDSNCAGRDDGNYAYPNRKNYFVQCTGGTAACQACFPLSMSFKQECNQCMYTLSDPCYTTNAWVPRATFLCPDLCPNRGPAFRGNIADPAQAGQYVGCWDGMTRACVRCPEDLLFNEAENACLYEGKYLTKPSK